jgi:large subunit ribosomal protein L15
MAEKKSPKKAGPTSAKAPAARKKTAAKTTAREGQVPPEPRRGGRRPPAAHKKTVAKKVTAASTISGGHIAGPTGTMLSLGVMKPAKGSWPKRTRVGRGHGSGMVKTGGEGGKGQTVRSGGGKGPAFEGGQTPWARRLPHKRGYSQKARDIGHFRATFAVLNLHQLDGWDPSIEVSPESLKAKGLVKTSPDGVKILGGSKMGKALPTGLKFRDIAFSASAREALAAAGAQFEEPA